MASSHSHPSHGPSSRVYDLPTEILCEIFFYCLDSPDNAGSYDLFTRNRACDGRTSPWDLTAVCRSWRQVGLDMPRLWCAPTFDITGEEEIQFHSDWPQEEWNCLTTALTRARNELITLDINLNGQHTYHWLSGLENVFPRVETLYLSGLPVRVMHNAGGHRFPRLRKLGLSVKFDHAEFERLHPDDALLDWNSVLSIIESSAPLHELTLALNIEDVILSIENISLNPSELPFTLEELTTLTLSTGSLIAMVPLLRTCPSLSTLTIRSAYMDSRIVMAPSGGITVALPSLQSLTLSNVFTTSVPSLLKCPQLRQLTATGHRPLSPVILRGILSRSHCALQTLDMEFRRAPLPDSEAIWRDILPLLSQLNTLTLRLGHAGVVASTLLLFTQPNAFPVLSSLVVRIGDSLDDVLFDEIAQSMENSERYQPAEAALVHFLDACVHKADGGVLPSLDVCFLHASYPHTDAGMPVHQQEFQLLAQMRRWKAEGVQVIASQRCKSAEGGYETLV